MKLTSLNIQSVANKSPKQKLIINKGRIKIVTEKIIFDKNLITTNAIEFKHTQFKCVVDNKLLDVICPDYIPKIIFSSQLNVYWNPMKVAIKYKLSSIKDIDIYWDYLYDNMEIKGHIINNVFIIDIKYIKYITEKLLNEYNRNMRYKK